MFTDHELIGLVQEECAEVIQIASKVRRFGMESRNPYVPNSKDNRTLLEDEIGDVLAIIKLMQENAMVDEEKIAQRVEWKLGKLAEYGHTVEDK